MTANEAAIRNAYQVAEDKDVPGWVNSFTEDGTFTDESIGVTYRGQRNSGAPSKFTRRLFPTCIGSCTAFTSPATRSWWNSHCKAHTEAHWNCPPGLCRRRDDAWTPHAAMCFN